MGLSTRKPDVQYTGHYLLAVPVRLCML